MIMYIVVIAIACIVCEGLALIFAIKRERKTSDRLIKILCEKENIRIPDETKSDKPANRNNLMKKQADAMDRRR